MAASPMVGQILQGGKTAELDLTPDNPLQQEPEQQAAEQGISDADKKKLVDIITTYRTDWAPDRLFRIPVWMKSNLFYRGLQVLGWDPQNQTYFDALAWYRQSGLQQPGSDDYLEKYINNLTLMLGDAYVGIMSQGVPGTKVKPENAEILADVTTSRAGQQAIGIIERMNKIRQMVRKENLFIYLYGVYLKVTKLVIDGDFAGYDEEPVMGQIPINKPDRYHCSQCGNDMPINGKQLGTGDKQTACPQCNSPLGPGDFYPGETVFEEGKVSTRKVPRVGVKWSVHSPLEFDADPQSKTILDSPVVSVDLEIDIGMARKMLPGAIKKIQEGADVQTTPNASYERLRRTESYSKGYGYTSDQSKSKITYSQAWMQPSSYYRIQDDQKDANGLTFSQRMEKDFPDGLKLSMLGPEVVHIRPACNAKELSVCSLHEEGGIFSTSIAENVVPFNERFNDITDLLDDWLQRCATGLVVYDTTKIDKKQLKGVQMGPGVLNGLATKGQGVDKPLGDALLQFKFEMDGNAFNYPGMILQWCYLISGLQPQTFGGGTQENVETAKGQQSQLNMANTRLRTGFENLKEEHAQSAQNALEMLQWAVDEGLITELWEVIEENGSEFRNNYVDLHKMNGRARVWPDEDQGLPQSPEQLRELFMTLIEEVREGNPVAIKLLDVETNQEVIMDSLTGNSGLVLPGAAQSSRTKQHINILLAKDWVPTRDPKGQPVMGLPVKPEKNVEDYIIADQTIKLFRQENGDLAQSNPEGWARLDAYYELLKSLESQSASEDAQRKAKVTQAGMPSPDPELVAAKSALLKDAAIAAESLTRIASAPPLPKGAGSANVSAGKEILDKTVKAVS